VIPAGLCQSADERKFDDSETTRGDRDRGQQANEREHGEYFDPTHFGVRDTDITE